MELSVRRTAEPTKLVATSPARHVVAALGLVDNTTTPRALFHVLSLCPFFELVVNDAVAGKLAVPFPIAVEAKFKCALGARKMRLLFRASHERLATRPLTPPHRRVLSSITR